MQNILVSVGNKSIGIHLCAKPHIGMHEALLLGSQALELAQAPS